MLLITFELTLNVI